MYLYIAGSFFFFFFSLCYTTFWLVFIIAGKQVANVMDEILLTQGVLFCSCFFDWEFYEFMDYEMLYSDMVLINQMEY